MNNKCINSDNCDEGKKFYDTIENFVKSVNILFHYINFKIKYNQQNIWN